MLLSETSSHNRRHTSKYTAIDEKHSADPKCVNLFYHNVLIHVERRYKGN